MTTTTQLRELLSWLTTERDTAKAIWDDNKKQVEANQAHDRMTVLNEVLRKANELR